MFNIFLYLNLCGKNCFLKKLVGQNVRQTFVFVGQFLCWVEQCPTVILSTGQNAGTLEDALKTIEDNLQKSISGLQNDVLNIKILLFNDGKKIIQN